MRGSDLSPPRHQGTKRPGLVAPKALGIHHRGAETQRTKRRNCLRRDTGARGRLLVLCASVVKILTDAPTARPARTLGALVSWWVKSGLFEKDDGRKAEVSQDRHQAETTTGREGMTNRRDFIKKAGVATAGVAAGSTLAAPLCEGPVDHPLAAADLCRPGPGGACHQAVHRRLQQGGERRDGDRALLRRPAGPDRRVVPRHAARHHRCGAVGR